ncbi:fimbrial protein [Paraburkholderia sp. ZP32-5]|uniref:fimbrial protein n=1 Tax=Paraburkholderia sp. ZP32-5 TaxID=2883245 RepID=UPI002DD43095|nr:fimbrial protein [Paraburkholderia sp. ZP32-5]
MPLDTSIPLASVPGASISGTLISARFVSQMFVTVNLVATGIPIVPGKLTLNPSGSGAGVTGRVGSLFALSGGGITSNVTVPSNQTTIAAPACSVTTPSSAVTLSPVPVSTLRGVGSAAGSGSVSLSLNCAADAGRIFVTLTDSTNPTNSGNTLSLASGSTASGVALQILDPSGNPILYGPDSSNVGNTNQWLVGPANVGTMNIPLTVRYVQTGAKVQPGTVNGVATFTMSYQ